MIPTTPSFQDEELVDGVMDGEMVAVGLYASSLRKQLFSEHLGLLDSTTAGTVDIVDPISDHFFHNVWAATSSMNTEILEEVRFLS